MTSYRQIWVDGSPVGIQGLDTTLEALSETGVKPGDERLSALLIARVGRDNYIPPSAQAQYAAALVREYAAFLAHQGEDDAPTSSSYRTWQGIPREQVPWYPTIDEDLCDGCGVCLRMCRAGAIVTAPNNKVRVAEPFACIVGCNACANLCKPGAILFPPRSVLDTLQPSGHNARQRAFGGGR